MRQKLIPGYLFLAMMIVLLHNVIPHHHHEEILMHNHDVHHDDEDAHSGKDHHPVKCLLQTLNLNVPRDLTIVKFEVPSDTTSLLEIYFRALLFSNHEFSLVYVPIPPGDPLHDGVITDLPPRAPPC